MYASCDEVKKVTFVPRFSPFHSPVEKRVLAWRSAHSSSPLILSLSTSHSHPLSLLSFSSCNISSSSLPSFSSFKIYSSSFPSFPSPSPAPCLSLTVVSCCGGLDGDWSAAFLTWLESALAPKKHWKKDGNELLNFLPFFLSSSSPSSSFFLFSFPLLPFLLLLVALHILAISPSSCSIRERKKEVGSSVLSFFLSFFEPLVAGCESEEKDE